MDKMLSGGAKRLLSLSHFNNKVGFFFFFFAGIIDVLPLELLLCEWVPRSS